MTLTTLPSAKFINFLLFCEIVAGIFLLDFLFTHKLKISYKVGSICAMIVALVVTIFVMNFQRIQRTSVLISNTSNVYATLENKELISINRHETTYTVYYRQSADEHISAISFDQNILYMDLIEVEEAPANLTMELKRGRLIFTRLIHT